LDQGFYTFGLHEKVLDYL